VSAFLERFSEELKIDKPAISPEAMQHSATRPGPGTCASWSIACAAVLIFTRGFAIQRDDIERAMAGAPGAAVPAGAPGSREMLQRFLKDYLQANAGPGCEPRLMESVERELLIEAMMRAGGNQSKAAELLGIPRPTLHAKLQRHGIRTTTVVDDGGGSPR
jgi:DNA-binding NtrC family response regulator